uniref:WEB family protein n=1 Tax=Leersia perrieri TaxID=77586 RepID=A0A0D9W5N6_9ORYZ
MPTSISTPRSGSFEAGLRAASPTTVSSKDSKPRLHRSRSTAAAAKAPPSPPPEKRRGGIAGVDSAMRERVAEMADELKKEREEKTRELEEVRRDCEKDAAEKVQFLQREVEKAKESERKMLESLIYQTKQLEQTKISLEEAKLEITNLQQANASLEVAAAAVSRRGGVEQRTVKDLVFGGGGDEDIIRSLRCELRTAMQGEEKSRKALDDLSVALSDVTMEAKQVKMWLSEAQAEAESANAEAERLRLEVSAAEARLREVCDEHERCRLDAEECAAAWGDKERVLLECVRASEEEVSRARQENTKLVESQRVIRDENARLRDILKQAVAEANAVKESLELARGENARLDAAVAEKDAALQSLRQEYECIKVSEAAAQGSLKELNSLLAATTTTAPATPASAKASDYGFVDQHLPSVRLVSSAKGTPESASHRWTVEKARTPSSRRYSIGEPAKLKGGFSQSARMGSLNHKERVFASLSNIADLKSAAEAAAMSDFDDEFDHIDESHYAGMDESMKQKKRRPILRKFGDLFRRKSFYKANLAPVHT